MTDVGPFEATTNARVRLAHVRSFSKPFPHKCFFSKACLNTAASDVDPTDYDLVTNNFPLVVRF